MTEFDKQKVRYKFLVGDDSNNHIAFAVDHDEQKDTFDIHFPIATNPHQVSRETLRKVGQSFIDASEKIGKEQS